MADETKKAEGIPLNASIRIEVSGGFYARLHQMYYITCNQVGIEEYKRLLQLIKDGKSNEDPVAYNLETLMTLLVEIEEKAKEQSKTTLVDLPQEK